MVKDTEERPSNGNAASEITLGGGESICRRSRLEEKEGEEYKDLGEDAGMMMKSIDSKGLEPGDEDEEGRKTVPHREGQVNPKFIVDVFWSMMLLHNVVDMRDGRTDKEGKDESDDVAAMTPEVDVDSIEKNEERQAPVDGVDDDFLAVVKELIDDSA